MLKAVLIPTPGQPEQEYLATHLQSLQLFPSLTQAEASIEKAIAVAASFNYQQPFTPEMFDQFKPVIEQQLKQLLKK